MDFSDDVGSVNETEIKMKVKELVEMIELHMNDSNAGELLRNGVQVCIVGKPNVGKSTLLNILCQRSAAIVSPVAGTTRDAIEQHLDIGGFPVKIIDTAGLRDPLHADNIELEGMKRASHIAQSSDLLICLLDASEFPNGVEIREWCSETLQNLGLKGDNICSKLIVLNKCDMLTQEKSSKILKRLGNEENMCLVSCMTKHGIASFTHTLKNSIEKICTRDQGIAR